MGGSGRGRLAPRLFTVGAGACDAAAGLGLLVAPDLVLRLLALPAPVGDRFVLRFLGVFVASVGFAYLYPFLGPAGPRREARLAAVIELTAGVRLAVALFLGCAVLAGRPPAWLLVGFTDAAFGLSQLALARRGFFRAGA
jgi:hypothetical protein